MGLHVPLQPIPVDFPCQLASPEPQRTPVSPAPWLLAGLVLLCLVPRALMALKIGSICPDGVLYIRLAKALDAGDFQTGFEEMRLNTFPVVLALLHRLGLDWELGGKLWGVLISSLTVLPIYGWARRQFDDRVALVACLLYAFHAKFIQWSPEIIRDPTFWFLFALSIYLLWRAVIEVRLWLFAAAGATTALAFLTRFEGLFLLIPLLLWSAWRWVALRTDRGRLAWGVVLCLIVLPALPALINFIWLHDYPYWEFTRLKPLALVQSWLEYLAGGSPSPEINISFGLSQSQVRMPLGQTLWTFVHTAEPGLTPIFALLMFGGMWAWRRLWLRREHQALFYTGLAVAGGMWIHLWCSQTSSNRYLLPIVILGSVFAALAVLGLSAWLARLLGRFSWGQRWQGATTAGLLTLLGVIGWGDALSSHYDFRGAEAHLGHWIQDKFGPSPLLLGSEGVTMVVNYYAQGRCYTFPMSTEDEAILASVEQFQPDVVLLLMTNRMRRMKSDRYGVLVERIKGLGFAQLDHSQLPPGSERLLVLVREHDQARVLRGPIPAPDRFQGDLGKTAEDRWWR